MTFRDDEASVQDNRPVEIYDVVFPTKTFNFTSHIREHVVDDVIYTPIASNRSDFAISRVGQPEAVIMSIPVNHEIVRLYTQMGVPPDTVYVVIRRKQLRSGEVERQWGGKITSLSIEGRIAKFRIPSESGEVALNTVSSVTCGKLCPHVVYDTMCKINREGANALGHPYKLATTVVNVIGRTVKLDLSNVPLTDPDRKDWLLNGELVHVASGRRRTIAKQVDAAGSTMTFVTLNEIIPGLQTGHAIETYAGCRNDIGTCDRKFGNRQNYGGLPQFNPEGGVALTWNPKDLT